MVWLKKSLKLAVEGEILAARLGPMLEKYLPKAGSNRSGI